MNGIARVFHREVVGICHNTQLIIFCFIMPVFWLLVVWGLLGNGVITHAPIALVDQDNSPASRKVIAHLSACRAIKFERYLEPDSALSSMRRGDTYAVLLIPAGYARNIERGNTMVLWLDENRYAVAGTVLSEITTALDALATAHAAKDALETGATPAEARRLVSIVHPDMDALGNEQQSFLAFLGSNLMPSLIMIGAMFSFVTAFLRELWHSSIAEWFACANWRIVPAIIGKLLPYFAIYVAIYLFYLFLFSGSGGFRITGNYWAMIALGCACLADFAAAAIVVAAVSPTWRMALVFSAGYAAPALPFTGFSMPLDSMSHAVALFGRCLPLTWYVQGQAEEWTLAAPISALHSALGGLAVIFIVLLCIGIPTLRLTWGLREKREAAA